MAKNTRLVLRTVPAAEAAEQSQAEKDREARLYWDMLSPEREAWELRKMGFRQFAGEDRANPSEPDLSGL